MNRHTVASACAFAFLLGSKVTAQSKSGVTAEVQAAYPRSEALYIDLHQHPELSFHEVETAAKLANEIRQLGYEVTTGIGRGGFFFFLAAEYAGHQQYGDDDANHQPHEDAHARVNAWRRSSRDAVTALLPFCPPDAR